MNNPVKPFQWSIKLDNGEIFVVEADNITDLFTKKEEMMIKILGVAKPVEPEEPPVDYGEPDNMPPAVETQSECLHIEYWVNVVKKEGKNNGKHFKSCANCKAFLGFTSEELGFHKLST